MAASRFITGSREAARFVREKAETGSTEICK